MNKSVTIIFFEDHFVCSILPNESAWELLKVNGSEKMWLYFYVNGGDVRNDDFAKERFEANDPNAFGNFYESIIKNNKTFKRFDMELESINLLKDIIEEVKEAYAERIVSFIPELSINEEISLNICFIPGVSNETQSKIIDYFLKEGFVLNTNADYIASIMNILQRKGIIGSKINLSMVESFFGDLLFHYIEFNDGVIRKESQVLIGKGVDYRIGNLAKLMVEKTARKRSSLILNDSHMLEQEIKKFHRRAEVEINNFYYNELDIKIELSDYTSARIIIDHRELEKMSAESFQFIKFKYEAFISKFSNLARTEKILLNGEVLSSDEFTQFFQKVFGESKIIKPFENFVELLSRGIFTNLPLSQSQEKVLEEEIEIKITISKKPPLPPFEGSKKINFPEKSKPAIPVFIPPNSKGNNKESLPKPGQPKVNMPPLPPSTKNNENDYKKKSEQSKIIKPKLPPLPPPPKKKTNLEFQLN